MFEKFVFSTKKIKMMKKTKDFLNFENVAECCLVRDVGFFDRKMTIYFQKFWVEKCLVCLTPLLCRYIKKQECQSEREGMEKVNLTKKMYFEL